jgi:hypothetical protein
LAKSLDRQGFGDVLLAEKISGKSAVDAGPAAGPHPECRPMRRKNSAVVALTEAAA